MDLDNGEIMFLLQTSVPNLDQHIADNKELLLEILNYDISKLIFIFIAIILSILLIVFLFGYLIKKVICNLSYVKIGKLILKSKKPENNQQCNGMPEQFININTFIGILDIIMSVELERIIVSSINATNEIRDVENEYTTDSLNVYERAFSVIESDYHHGLVDLACKKTNFDMGRIKSTREYFFIMDLMREYHYIWMQQAKDISRRNGFVEFITDKSKSKEYIDELNNSIYRCIDMGKLESTSITRDEIKTVIDNCAISSRASLECMFVNLATMKMNMLKKRTDKLTYIDNSVKTSVVKILKDVRDKLACGDIFGSQDSDDGSDDEQEETETTK